MSEGTMRSEKGNVGGVSSEKEKGFPPMDSLTSADHGEENVVGKSKEMERKHREDTFLWEVACILCDLDITCGGDNVERILVAMTEEDFPYGRFCDELGSLEKCKKVRDEIVRKVLQK